MGIMDTTFVTNVHRMQTRLRLDCNIPVEYAATTMRDLSLRC